MTGQEEVLSKFCQMRFTLDFLEEILGKNCQALEQGAQGIAGVTIAGGVDVALWDTV